MKLFGSIAILMMALSVYAGSASTHFEGTPETSSSGEAKWVQKKLRVYLDLTETPAGLGLDKDSLRKMLSSASQLWNSVDAESPRFILLEDGPVPTKSVEVEVRFARDGEDLRFFTGDNAGAAAVTRLFASATGNLRRAIILINPNFPFDSPDLGVALSLKRVMAHELGHALGLTHSIALSSIMFSETAYANPSSSQRLFLTEDDHSRVRSLYGGGSSCCIGVVGRIELLGEVGVQDFSGYHLVVENLKDSRLIAVGDVLADGTFFIGGLAHRELGIRILNEDSVVVGVMDTILIESEEALSATFELGVIPVTLRRLDQRAFLGDDVLLTVAALDTDGKRTLEFNVGFKRSGIGSKILFGHFGGIFSDFSSEILFDGFDWGVWRVVARFDQEIPEGEFSFYIESDGFLILVPGALRVRK